jgi:hypothetical protein
MDYILSRTLVACERDSHGQEAFLVVFVSFSHRVKRVQLAVASVPFAS